MLVQTCVADRMLNVSMVNANVYQNIMVIHISIAALNVYLVLIAT